MTAQHTTGRETVLRGQCLCGAIGYEVTQLDGEIMHCHCRTCRKAHASAFASTVRVERGHFRWLRGEARLVAYQSSPGKIRRFCATCGSHLMAERPAQPHVILRVATLDDDPGDTPAMHIWTSHAVPWLETADDLPRHAAMPSRSAETAVAATPGTDRGC
jgi:ADP-ribosyl-[dinitrogen reductase] hydrolase